MYFSVINFKDKSSFLRGGPNSGPDKETLLQSTMKVKAANSSQIEAPFQYAGRHIPEQTLLQKYLGVWISFAAVYVSRARPPFF
jgi:hypothetical protein